jgi:hypothetical protein
MAFSSPVDPTMELNPSTMVTMELLVQILLRVRTANLLRKSPVLRTPAVSRLRQISNALGPSIKSMSHGARTSTKCFDRFTTARERG